jgi:Transmembrane secretion effector
MRNARLYFIGLAASLLGNSAMTLVAGIWVKSLTGSSAKAGLVSVCIYAPTIAAPVAGMLVDRVDRQRWLVGVNLASGLAILSVLAVRSARDVWIVYAAMIAYGTEIVLTDPAEDALFAAMLPLELRRRMNGWRLGIQETGRLIAPLLGAGLFSLVGGGSVAALDAATFGVAAVAVSRLRVNGSTARPDRGRLWRELSAGYRHIVTHSELRCVTMAAAAAMALSGVGVAAQYSLVKGVGEPPAFLGVLTAALGAGSIVAALSAGRLLRRMDERRLALAGLFNFAAGDLLRATGWLPGAIIGSVVLGFALPWVFLAVLSLAQSATPSPLQGRVSAAVGVALFAPQAPTQAAGAFAITQVTFGEIFIASAVTAALIALWLGLQPEDQARHRR